MQKRSDEADWNELRTPDGLAAWERRRKPYSPSVDIARSSWSGRTMDMTPSVDRALTDYMHDTSVDTLINWFKRTPSDDSVKFTVASIIATRETHLRTDLPFIQFYLYKMNETTAKMSESQFNQILTIDKDHFHIRSGVDKLFGGDRTKHCSIILDIEDMLKHLGVGYTMSDQAKECRKQPPSSHQELDSMKDARYLHLGEGAFGADDDYFILNSAGATDLPPGGPLPPFVARDLKSSDQYRKSYAKLQKTEAKAQETKRLADVRASALSDLKSSSRVSLLVGEPLSDELKKHMAAGSRKASKSRKSRKSKKARKSKKVRKSKKARKSKKFAIS